MPINFPSNPSDGDTFTDKGRGWTYVSSIGAWRSLATFTRAITTDLIEEGTTNLFATDERIEDHLSDTLVAGSNINLIYDDVAGTLTISASVGSAAVGSYDLSANTTDELAQGSTNFYYTDARVATFLNGNLNSSIIPDTDVTYDLGSVTNRFRDLYLSGNTIDLGGTLITSDGTKITLPAGTSIHNAGTLLDESTSTTDHLNEGITNFYYTDARVGNYLTTNSYATESYVQSQIETKDNTDEINEGSSNLYFTNERVDDRVSALLTAGQNITLQYNDVAGTLTISANNIGGYDLSQNSTDDLGEGPTNLYYTDTRARLAISVSGDLAYDNTTGVISTQGLASSTTDDLAEGTTNLYYTDARADARITNALAGNITISGNLTVSGTTTTLNTATLEVEDLNITVAKNATDSATANGSGLTVAGANATFTYTSADDRWNLNKDLNANVYGTLTGNVIGQVSDLSNHTSDALAEGTTNLYFTPTNLAATSIDSLQDVDITSTPPTEGQVLVWDNANSTFVPGDAAADFSDLTGSIDISQIADNSITLEKIIGSDPIVDEFTADGTTASFTLSQEPGSTAAVQVFVDSVPQLASNYTVVGTTLTLGGIPNNGQVVEARAYGLVRTVDAPADGTISEPKLQSSCVSLEKLITDNTGTAGQVLSTTGAGLEWTTVDFTGYATEGYADQAEADAITSANSYTDTRETAITTAYQTYADTKLALSGGSITGDVGFGNDRRLSFDSDMLIYNNAFGSFVQEINPSNTLFVSGATIDIRDQSNNTWIALDSNGTTISTPLTIDSVRETFSTGIVNSPDYTLDLSAGSTALITFANQDFELDITNAPTSGTETIGVALIVEQGTTGYIPTSLTINGSTVTIQWINASVPTGNASQTDVFSFTLINNAGTYSALGSLSTFG
jgi:hypothetical protein